MFQIKIQVKFLLTEVDSQFPLSPSPDYSWIRQETKENENQPRWKNLNLNLILTCNCACIHYQITVSVTWHTLTTWALSLGQSCNLSQRKESTGDTLHLAKISAYLKCIVSYCRSRENKTWKQYPWMRRKDQVSNFDDWGSRIEKQGFYVKLFLFSERTMLYSHLAIFTLSISACAAVFCHSLNCSFGKLSISVNLFFQFRRFILQ